MVRTDHPRTPSGRGSAAAAGYILRACRRSQSALRLRGLLELLPSRASPRLSFRAAGVTKVFGDTVALWGVDLEGRSGDLVAIHGSNGSGKTTLLRIIAGLTTPTRGRLTWTTDTPGAPPRIGLVGHASHLFDELTALENVHLAARLARNDEAAAIDLLGRLGVEHAAGRRTAGLSSGTRRRVGLARALVTGPDVLLVDEPFAGLDASAADLVERVLVETRSEGRLVVIATHDEARSRSIATSIVLLDAGHLRPQRSVMVGARRTGGIEQGVVPG